MVQVLFVSRTVLSIKSALSLQLQPDDPAHPFGHIAVHYISGPVGLVAVLQYVET